MIRTYIKAYLLLFSLLLSACGSNYVTRPTVIQDAESHTNIGVQAFSEGDFSRAQLLFSRALFLYQGLDNQQGEMLSHINLAEVALVTGNYPTVEKHLLNASTIANNTFQTEIQSRINLLSAQSALIQKQFTLAKKRLQPLLPEFEDETLVSTASHIQLVACADRTQIAVVENSNASLWTHRYTSALKLSDSKDPILEARLLRFQAVLLQEQGSLDAAESTLLQALNIYKENFSRSGIAETLNEMGQLSIAQNREQDAKEYIARALAVYRYLDNTKKIAQLNETLMSLDASTAPRSNQ